MQIGFTKKAEEALELAAEAASELGHTSVGTEHILLGLLRFLSRMVPMRIE